MHINQVWAAYFSGTDTTKTIVTAIAQEIAQALGVPCAELNFTPPQAREQHYTFAPTDLVICGTPVIAGRVPNVLLPFLTHGFTGSHALAVPVVLFGNRNYDDALMELREILEADGLRTVHRHGRHRSGRPLSGPARNPAWSGYPTECFAACGSSGPTAGKRLPDAACPGFPPSLLLSGPRTGRPFR